ncbi:hypothetical protein L3Q82_002922 [Scortum barcoo]|uniref:Uncharacterized protein n=1 Tax=Scortum barcoo TaxID=214431 RepID=A0ACB8VV41_9TELE|nr:hypothetical protein L3Q82_002922 [Scortum barcoo]
MMWSFWPHRVVTSSSHWDGSQLSVKRLGISTSKSEAMALSREEFLPQVKEFKYLGVLFTSEGKMEREMDRRIGAASAVLRTVVQSVVLKRELSQKAKLSIYWSIYIPTLTYGHELWVNDRKNEIAYTSG